MSATGSKPTLLYVCGLGGVVLVGLGVVALSMVRTSQVRAEAEARAAAVKAGPRIQTAGVERAGGEKELVLQGEARPYMSATLYAKLSGYLRELKVDKGDSVRADQVLAIIDSVELDRQYDAAVADMRYKQANAKRLEDLVKSGVATGQDGELTRSAALVAEATVAALATQKGYEILKAPFRGTVTARYADPGALIQNATNTQTSALPVVTISQIDRLRVDIYVDQRDAPFVHEGDALVVTLPERPELKLDGRVARVSHELDSKTRMMLAEVDLENTKGTVVPGSFVEVKIKVKAPSFLSVPVEALVLRGKKTFVAVVSNDNKVTYVPVSLADNDGRHALIREGVSEGQQVALNLGDSVVDGDRVRPAGSLTPP
jgi:RND family efflux transporter MFP subunit